jgi:hypothetical protein
MAYDINNIDKWKGSTGIYGVCSVELDSHDNLKLINHTKCCDNSCTKRYNDCNNYCKSHKYKDCKDNCKKIRKSCRELCYYYQPNIVEGFKITNEKILICVLAILVSIIIICIIL